jgi:hypothetical protein
MRYISVQERTNAVGIVTARRSLKEACFSSLYLFLITNCFQIFNFVVFNVWIQFEFIKSRQRFNRSHLTIVRLVRKLNRTGSADEVPRRPKHRATIRQQDRYMQINSTS